MKVAVTGGAGRMALSAIHDFIENDDVEKLLLTDRDQDALEIRKKNLNSAKIETYVVDITDTGKLADALKDYDVVLNASSHLFNMKVMDACLESKTHYTDFGGLFHWAKKQLKKDEDFKKAGITGIVGSGSAPGMVNVMAKYAVDRLDTVETVLILDAIINPGASGYKFVPPYALNTLVDEFSVNNFEFINGEMVELPAFSGKMTVDFPEPYGRLNLYNMIHSEVATMPISFKEKGIKNVAFKLALPALFEERLRFLVENGMASKDVIDVNGTKVSPRDFMLAMFEERPGEDSSNTTPSDMKLLRVIAEGKKDGKNVTIKVETDLNLHPWGMTNGAFTVGFPGAVTARMLGNGWVKEKGFFSSESVIDPDIYFRELAMRDIHMTCTTEETIS